jgi:hypothetical protein
MGRLARLAAVVLVLAWPATGPARATATAGGGFGDWAVIVVSGDDHAAHEDRFTAAFDNARRDVAAGLEARGFSVSHMAQLSANPHEDVDLASGALLFARLGQLARDAPAGCLVYVTSHGSPRGVLVGDELLSPGDFARSLTQTCGERPTVVIISACFSGVFVPALSQSDRFVLTAARRDRSSFGCSESDRYPFFDGCLIQALPTATDFADLAKRTRRCVAAREDEEGMLPRSEPQLFVGAAFAARVLPFAPPGRRADAASRGDATRATLAATPAKP